MVSFVADISTLVESRAQKGKFPPSLKPPLANLAILAIKLDEYDDEFFALMPMLFPYNKFTMTVRFFNVLVYVGFGVSYLTSIFRNLSSERSSRIILRYLIEPQDDLLARLTQIANEGFSKAKEEWEKNLLLWGTDLPRSPSLSLSLSLIVTLFISRQTPGQTTHRSC